MEGPFFVDERLQRSDLTGASRAAGIADAIPLQVLVTLRSARGACEPLPAMQVDVWHCDALGRYSDVGDQRGEPFLRGYQVSDSAGRVTFTTVYPGWYPGRTVHIHLKVRPARASAKRGFEFTTQMFFDEATNDTVLAQGPYASRGRRDTRNRDEGIEARTPTLMARVSRDANNRVLASLDLTLDLPQAA